ncbi:hypothetical protein BH09MYX1_BH09MYX1_11500 [soil metagenome]
MGSDQHREGPTLKSVPRYATLKKKTDTAVVRWEWATGNVDGLDPFHIERKRFTRGRRLKSAPRVMKSGFVAQGFDARDRLVVERRATGIPDRFAETFFVHAKDAIDSLSFTPSEAPLFSHGTLFIMKDGRVIRSDFESARGKTRTQRYGYEGQRLAWVKTAAPKEEPFTERFAYDDRGELATIFVERAGKPAARVYFRPRPDETLAALGPEIHRRLVDAVIASLARAKKWLREPVYGIAICMNMEAYQYVLPPFVALGLASERTAFVKKHGKRAPDFVWSPSEWSLFDDDRLALRDDDLVRACKLANEDIWQNERFGRAVSLCEDVATDLRKRKLPIKTTRDAVVFVTDISSGDGAKKVKKLR